MKYFKLSFKYLECNIGNQTEKRKKVRHTDDLKWLPILGGMPKMHLFDLEKS